ncbi:hypothetical protein PR048_032662, partial [Dryococelus australis]
MSNAVQGRKLNTQCNFFISNCYESGNFLKQWINSLIAFGLFIDEQISILQVMGNETANMRILQPKCLMPFQKGILVTINPLREMREFLNVRYSLKFILTSRLNQDVLESFFYFLRVRSVGHGKKNPTAVDFKYRLRLLLIGYEMPLPVGACVSDGSLADKPYLTSQMFISLNTCQEERVQNTTEHQSCDVSFPDMTTEENEALCHVAGYLAHSTSDRSPASDVPANE